MGPVNELYNKLFILERDREKEREREWKKGVKEEF